MRYALNNCVTSFDDDNTVFTGLCIRCKKTQEVTVAQNSVRQYQAGALIQNCCPQLNADEREFLISGVCGKCFDEMFQ